MFLIYHSLPALTGSLKHKDLKGQVVSSQVYMDTEDDHAGEETAEAADETADEATDDYQPENPDSEEDRETE